MMTAAPIARGPNRPPGAPPRLPDRRAGASGTMTRFSDDRLWVGTKAAVVLLVALAALVWG